MCTHNFLIKYFVVVYILKNHLLIYDWTPSKHLVAREFLHRFTNKTQKKFINNNYTQKVIINYLMRKYKFTTYQNMSQAVVISESIGGNPFSDKRFRYTGPTDGFPFSPLTPSSTFAAKDFILWRQILEAIYLM